MFNNSCYNFDCGYINRPCFTLRPISCITPCPRFSCPPHFHFTSNNNCCCSNPCIDNCFVNFPNCCPNLNNNCCNVPNCCNPYNNVCNNYFKPFPNFKFNSNLIWFLGGFNCGKNSNKILENEEF